MSPRQISFMLFIMLYISVSAQDKTKVEESALKKQLNFLFVNALSNTELDSVEVSVLMDSLSVLSFNSGCGGKLTIFIQPGTYAVSINRTGYLEKIYKEFKVPEKGVGMFRISLNPNK